MTEYYKNRISEILIELEKQSLLLKRMSFLRLIAFLSGLILLFFLSGKGLLIAMILILLYLAGFLFIIVRYNRLEMEIDRNRNLIKVFNNELDTEQNRINIFGSGIEYLDYFHPYSGDLDFFGNFSVFNRINRAVTFEGKEIIAKWLMGYDFKKDQISQRHEAVNELSDMNSFMEDFLNCFFIGKELPDESIGIKVWLNKFPKVTKYGKYGKYLLMLSTIVLLSLIVLSFSINGIFPILFTGLIISFAVNLRFKKKIDIIHNHASRQAELFRKYVDLLDLIDKNGFSAFLLNQLKQNLTSNNKFRNGLIKIASIIRKLDYRLNFMAGPFLNVLFFWDLHHCIKLADWIGKNRHEFDDWLSDIGKFDALVTIACLKFNNPDWCFPVLGNDNKLYINALNMGHPLINNCVANDYSISGEGKFDIVTGSNMAGKSTFLRSLGVNIVLGMAGFPVKASFFEFTPTNILSYMRINDSIELELSTFHAELDKIKRILDFVRINDKTFLLLDELLRGTNTRDRQTGSTALIQQLIKNKASGIVATHDLNLTDLETKLPGKIRNYNFSIQTVNEELYFDYKLKSGVCNTFNAALLMKKIGIDILED